ALLAHLETPAIPGWASSAFTTSLAPWTRLSTPAGIPASCTSSRMRVDENGTCSLGLSTNVLPVAIAYGQNQQGTIAGKLNGVIAAKTPNGWRTYSQSIPAATSSSALPIISVGMPHACSTFSIA